MSLEGVQRSPCLSLFSMDRHRSLSIAKREMRARRTHIFLAYSKCESRRNSRAAKILMQKNDGSARIGRLFRNLAPSKSAVNTCFHVWKFLIQWLNTTLRAHLCQQSLAKQIYRSFVGVYSLLLSRHYGFRKCFQ